MPDQPNPATPSTPDATAAIGQTLDGVPPTAGGADGGTGDDDAPSGEGIAFTVGAGVERGARTRPHERRPGDPVYRPLWIYTLDPGESRLDGAQAIINVPYEPLGPGPSGALFRVEPVDVETGVRFLALDPEAPDVLIGSGRPPSPADARFHQQMVYAVCSTVYAAFRAALGRHVAWGFDGSRAAAGRDAGFGTRLTIYPHGARAENAWYDPAAGALRFGYFRARPPVTGRNVPNGFVFTCLSHDVVAHEVTHALLDGLRARFTVPTGPDVLGFHEGFADLVAILQHFSYPEVVRAAIARSRGHLGQASLLTGLAQQFGHTTRSARPLRTAIDVDAHGRIVPRVYRPEAEPHALGSVLVSAVFSAFLTVFERKTARYVRLATNGTGALPAHELPADLRDVLATEASQLASQFLSICIRAVDYCPPVDLELGEYLRAVVTADMDLVPDDPWGYREAWVDAFSRHGIYPPDVRSLADDELCWQPPERPIAPNAALTFARLQFSGDPACAAGPAELRRQAVALGATLAQDHAAFGLVAPGGDASLPRVQSIRSSRRIGPDGQVLFDLVAEVTQRRVVHGDDGVPFVTWGGATVLIGPRGEVRYVIAKNVGNARRIARQGAFLRGAGRELWHVRPDGRRVPKRDLFRALHQGRR